MQAFVPEPGSPGLNSSCGVAVTVTGIPVTESVTEIVGCQLVTDTNTGTSTTDGTPRGGLVATTG